jgi:hypothetical protein
MILKIQNKETNTWLVFDKIDHVEIQEHISHIKNKKRNIDNFMRFKIIDLNCKKIMDYKSFVNHILFNPRKTEENCSLTHIFMVRKNKISKM